MWKRVGFVRFSPEYWLLGSLLTDRLSAATTTASAQGSGSGDGTAMAGTQTPSTDPGKPKSVEPILEKYDQTSMRQVNDLITDFQKLHVD